eukprot:3896746-Pyramimonas_sp.AAC.1
MSFLFPVTFFLPSALAALVASVAARVLLAPHLRTNLGLASALPLALHFALPLAFALPLVLPLRLLATGASS